LQAEQLVVPYAIPLPGFKGWFRKGRFEAVKGIAMELPAGQTLGVLGESGSGKSTLALAALGLLGYEGRLQVMQQDWREHKTAAAAKQLRQQVQVVFQDPYSSLSPRMTIEQIVGEGLRVHAPELSDQERQDRVLATLREVGLLPNDIQGPALSEWLARYPHAFSGGQRQRLAIARALIVQPRMLVLDEPTSALDVTVQQQVIDLLLHLQRSRGLSYLLITHDMDVIWAMAHRVMVMQGGEVVEQGDAEQVLKHPQHPYTQKLLSACAPL
jgi:microcin C transport system ATP-binding protein